MYLQMRSGLANSFPDHPGDRSDRWRALQILGPEAEKSRSEAFASRDPSLRIEKTRLFQGTGRGGLGPARASALHKRASPPLNSPRKPGIKPVFGQSDLTEPQSRNGPGTRRLKRRFAMSEIDHRDGVSRRKVLECMTWCGTGVLWTISGGVPHSLGIMGEAQAADTRGLTFLQISDSHVGFDKPANPNALGTLEEAIKKVNALPQKPAFMIHTGDITHLSKEKEFDDADHIISQSRLDVHYVPGEHDFVDTDRKIYSERYGRAAKGHGWYSFDANGVHFIGLVNTFDLKAGGLGNLGTEQLEWLEHDVKGRSASTPIVLFAHVPLWTVYQDWGWGTDDSAQALSYLKKFGSVTVLNGHIHQVMQKVEGNVTFHTARSTAFPQPAPGTAPSPGPMKVPEDQLRKMLGIANVNFKQNEQRLAIVDSPLQG